MNSIISNKPISYVTNALVNETNKSTEKNIISTSSNTLDSSDISEEAKIGYEFSTRIEDSIHSINESIDPNFLSKYTLVYSMIKKEIDSGVYGSDTKKYTSLLNSSFNNAITLASTSLINQASISTDVTTDTLKQDKKCPLSSTTIACQKQIETASLLIVILKAENKQITESISRYKKKKNHEMVASLNELRRNYNHIINNLSDTINLVQGNSEDPINTSIL